MTLDQIIQETRDWPAEKTESLIDPEVEEAWKHETRRRLVEIENGTAQPVEGETVSARIRQIVGR